MPIMPCQKDGKNGFKFGETGECYQHDDSDAEKAAARAKAEKQGRAIEWSKHRQDAYPNEHSVRIRDPGDFDPDSFRSQMLPKSEDGKGGVRMVEGHLKGETTMTVQAYRFPADLYTIDQVHAWLKKYDIKKWIKIEPAKQEDQAGDLTYEYLKAVYDRVMAHPGIWDKLKGEIHIQSRASAGGKLRSRTSPGWAEAQIHLQNDAPGNVNGRVHYEDNDIIEVGVVPIKEGVFTGSDGIPTLRRFESFAPYVHWLDGVPITPGHVAPISGEVVPTTPRPGKLLNTRLREEKRDAYSVGRYFKKGLTPEQIQMLRDGVPIHGSIEFNCNLKNESGEFHGKHYDREEMGEYVFYNYAEVPRGACTPADGCGILMNAAPGDISNDDSILNGENFEQIDSHEPGSNAGTGDNNMIEGDAIPAQPDVKNLLTESVAPIVEKITKIETIFGDVAKRLTILEGGHKQLNESFEAKKKTEDEAKDAAQKGEFKKMLNAANITEVDKLWPEVKGLNPAQWESWKKDNSGKLLNEAEQTKLKGQKMINSAGSSTSESRQKMIEARNKKLGYTK